MAEQTNVEDIEQALVHMRRSMSRRSLQRRGDPHATPVSGALFATLDALEDTPLGVTEIADAIGVDQPRASKLVARAEAEQLVHRVAHETDARRHELHLTRAGQRVIAAGHATRRAAVERALEGFSDRDAANLARLLTAFVDQW